MLNPNAHFKTIESLQPVVQVINEAAAALDDPTRTVIDSSIQDLLTGSIHATSAAAGSIPAAVAAAPTLAAAGGLTATGLALGALALAGPAIALAGAGLGALAVVNEKQLRDEKVRLYNAAGNRRRDLSRLLQAEDTLTLERRDYLHSLDTLLAQAMTALREDLEL